MSGCGKALDVFLAVVEELVQDTSEAMERMSSEDDCDGQEMGRVSVEQRVVTVLCHLLECQHVGIALFDGHGVLCSVAVAYASLEQERYWQRRLLEIRRDMLFPGSRSLARLRAGKTLAVVQMLPATGLQPSSEFIAPLFLQQQELAGILHLGYGYIKARITTPERALVPGIARLTSLVLQRERSQREKEQALAALQVAHKNLARLHKMRGSAIATVGYEFLTALASIKRSSEMIREHSASLEMAKEFAADIAVDAGRLERMIHDVLDLERLEAGRVKLNLEWLNLNTVLCEVVHHLRQVFPQQRLSLQLAKALPILLADGDKLTLLLTVLMSKMLRTAGGDGEIRVRSMAEGDLVHIWIADGGREHADSDLEDLFDVDTQMGERMQRGEWVGLSVETAREIMQMHGGEIWVERREGRGVVLHLTVRFTDASVF